MNRQTEIFSFIPPINCSEGEKWLMRVTSFETTKYVFNISDENNSSSVSSTSYWTPEDGEELINKLNKRLELRSENDNKLHVKEVEKGGTRIEIENSG